MKLPISKSLSKMNSKWHMYGWVKGNAHVLEKLIQKAEIFWKAAYGCRAHRLSAVQSYQTTVYVCSPEELFHIAWLKYIQISVSSENDESSPASHISFQCGYRCDNAPGGKRESVSVDCRTNQPRNKRECLARIKVMFLHCLCLCPEKNVEIALRLIYLNCKCYWSCLLL